MANIKISFPIAFLLIVWFALGSPAPLAASQNLAPDLDPYVTSYSVTYSGSYSYDVPCDWEYSFTGSNGHEYVVSSCTGVEICANEIGLAGSRDTVENLGTKTVTVNYSYSVDYYTCHYISQVNKWSKCDGTYQYGQNVTWSTKDASGWSDSSCKHVTLTRTCQYEDD